MRKEKPIDVKKLLDNMPKRTKEQKIVSSALQTLRSIDIDTLDVEDQQGISYAIGLLESIMFASDL